MNEFSWPRGVLTALVTPLRDDSLDPDALGDHLDDQLSAGIAGFVVAGGTGEFGTLSLQERRTIASSVVGQVAGRAPVIVQTGALATRDALELSQHAASIGADALLVASPFGEPITWNERARFYTDIAASTELPLMIYNTPPSGLLALDQIQQLARIEGVSAVKDSSGDMALLGDLLAWSEHREFAVYVGMDSLIRDAFRAGVRGVVFGSANLVPRALVAIADDPSSSTDELWRALRAFLRPLEESSNYVAVCKAFLTAAGVDVGEVRRPYLRPTQDEIDSLAEQQLNVLSRQS